MNEGSIYGSIYASWYQQLGSQYATNYSFPSGHTMAAMAGMSVVFAYGNKRYSWLAYLYVLIMGITRIYFVVHYPTDILAGLITGGIGALAAISIVNWVMGYCAKHQEKAWCRLLTNKPEGEKASYAEN
jgi:undecaprenyl-diphosphatase